MNTADYESAKAASPTSARGECAPGQIDLSAQAFAKLADHTKGRTPVTWKLVSPAGPGTMSIRHMGRVRREIRNGEAPAPRPHVA